MKTLLNAVAFAIIAAATAGVAEAQPYGQARAPAYGQPRDGVATLYELPGFQGRQTVIYGRSENLPRQFNDMAMSGRFEGRWRICEHSDFGGRCAEVQGDVSDLQSVGLGQRVSSLQSLAYDDDDRDDDRYGDGYGYGRGDRGPLDDGPVEGARNVFFPYPSYRGRDVEATAGAADRFCRTNRLGTAAYFETAPRSDGPSYGRYPTGGPVLRDVLCRRWGGGR